MKSPNKNNNLFTSLFVLISLLSISLLSACGSGSGGGDDDPAPIDAVVDVNPIGFYQGTAKVNEGSSTIDVTLQAIVDVDTIIVVDVSNHLMYKGSINDSNITGNEFTGTVNVYKNGVNERVATVQGTITEASKIKVTLSGTGDYTTGDVDLDYVLYNSRAPKTLSDAKEWSNTDSADILFNTETNVDISLIDSINIWGGCSTNRGIDVVNVNSEQPGRIRKFTTIFDNECEKDGSLKRTVDAYFTTFDNAGEDDQMLFVVFDATGSYLIILDETLN